MSKEPKAAAAPAPAPAPAEAPAAEGPAPKVKKERKEKKPKANVQVWKLYKAQGAARGSSWRSTRTASAAGTAASRTSRTSRPLRQDACASSDSLIAFRFCSVTNGLKGARYFEAFAFETLDAPPVSLYPLRKASETARIPSTLNESFPA